MNFVNKFTLHLVAVATFLFSLFPQNSTLCLSEDGCVKIEYRCDCESESTGCCPSDEISASHDELCFKDHCRDTQIIKFTQLQPSKSVAPIKIFDYQSLFWHHFSNEFNEIIPSKNSLLSSSKIIDLPQKFSLLILESTVLRI